MNGPHIENAERIKKINDYTHSKNLSSQIVLMPPHPFLHEAVKTTEKNAHLKIGAQDCSTQNKMGSYTGEVSATMLNDIGCKYVLIGHSERRQFFHESFDMLKKKMENTLVNNLIPILCIGETKEQKEADQTFNILEKQVKEMLPFVTQKDTPLIIAYEPIWAIGTGLTASIDTITETHNYIQRIISPFVSRHIPILYGGSVNTENAVKISQIPSVDGLLIGGASLNSSNFCDIISNIENKR